MKAYVWSHIILALGVIGAFFYGGIVAATSVVILAILEVSLSFDNAVVNAKVLKNMTPVWQDRFIKYGIPVAVFGMRGVFPILIVSIATGMGMFDTFQLAVNDPSSYHAALEANEVGIFLFGGGFLLMVALSFFLDDEKDEHWFPALEDNALIAKLSEHSTAVSAMIAAVVVSGVGSMLPMVSYGIGTFISAYAGIGLFLALNYLDDQLSTDGVRHGMIGFLYLEVLDASFSFDGVIGAFAVTGDIFIIMIGLGVGAMYVRSMTIDFVKRGTLDEFKFLEHGAMYAILALAIIMMIKVFYEVPEIITGLVGVAFIGVAFYHSYIINKRDEGVEEHW